MSILQQHTLIIYPHNTAINAQTRRERGRKDNRGKVFITYSKRTMAKLVYYTDIAGKDKWYNGVYQGVSGEP